jgi:hypothetical protein
VTIKPIDIQTNMGQMHEVARHQHAQNEALIQQMHHLDKEALDKANIADTHLDESKESQHATNRLDEHQTEGRKRRQKEREKSSLHRDEKRGIEFVEDESLGRIIDVKK